MNNPLSKKPYIISFLICFILIFGLTLWLLNAPLAGAIVSPGKIISIEGTRHINHPTGGVIDILYVKEGNYVEQNDPLIKLKDHNLESEIMITENNIVLTKLKIERLKAEINKTNYKIKHIKFPFLVKNDRLEQFYKEQDHLTKQNIITLNQEIKKLNQQKNTLKIQEENFRKQFNALGKQIDFLTEKLKGQNILLKKGYTPKQYVLELQAQIEEFNAEKIMAKGNEIQSLNQRLEIEEEIKNLIQNKNLQIYTEITDLTEEYISYITSYEALKIKEENLIIRSPISGMVQNMEPKGKYESVNPNKTLLTIVPYSTTWLVEAELSPASTSELSIGNLARLHFISLQGLTPPTTEAEVIFISKDSYLKENQNQPIVKTKLKFNSKNIDWPIQSGMPLQVFFPTPEKTMAEYIFRPILDKLRMPEQPESNPN